MINPGAFYNVLKPVHGPVHNITFLTHFIVHKFVAGTEIIAANLVVVGTWFYDNYNNTVFIGEVSRILPMKDPVTVSEVSTPVPENSTAEKKDKAPEKSEVSG